jgi:hypothetical protein
MKDFDVYISVLLGVKKTVTCEDEICAQALAEELAQTLDYNEYEQIGVDVTVDKHSEQKQ